MSNMQGRTKYIKIGGCYVSAATEEAGHPYRPTQESSGWHSWTLIGRAHIMPHSDWLKSGAPQRTTLGCIVFRKEMNAR